MTTLDSAQSGERLAQLRTTAKQAIRIPDIPVNGNSEKITRVLEILTEGLAPYVEGKLRAIYKENWTRSVQGSFRDDRSRAQNGKVEWDAHSLLTVMWDQWNSVFRHDL